MTKPRNKKKPAAEAGAPKPAPEQSIVPANDETGAPSAANPGDALAARKAAAKAAFGSAVQQAGPALQKGLETAKKHPVLVGAIGGFLFGGPAGAFLGAASATEAGKKAMKEMVDDGVNTIKTTIKAVKEARQETAEDRERKLLEARLEELKKKKNNGPGQS